MRKVDKQRGRLSLVEGQAFGRQTMTISSAASIEAMCAEWLAQAEQDPDTIPAILDELDKLLASIASGDTAARLVLRRARRRLNALRGSSPTLTVRKTHRHG
jgi:hypothetical protein